MNADQTIFRSVCICVFLSLIPPAAPTSQPSTLPTTQPIDYFALSSDDFAQLKELDQPIDELRLNRKLLSAAILNETNRYRAQENLSPLKHLDKLDEAEMLHVRDMVQKQYLAHEETGTKTPHPWDRVVAVGLKPQYVGENIATMFGIQYTGGKHAYPLSQWHREGLSYTENGEAIPPHTYRTFARDAVKQWIDSPGHRVQIMRPETQYLGFACAPAKFQKRPIDNDFHKCFVGQIFFTPKDEETQPQINADERR